MSMMKLQLQFFGGRGSGGGKSSGGGGGGGSAKSMKGENGETLPKGTELDQGEWKRTSKGISVLSSDGTRENIVLEGRTFKRGKDYTSHESIKNQMEHGELHEGVNGTTWRSVTTYTEYKGSKTGERYLLKVSDSQFFLGKNPIPSPEGGSRHGIVQKVWRLGK